MHMHTDMQREIIFNNQSVCERIQMHDTSKIKMRASPLSYSETHGLSHAHPHACTRTHFSSLSDECVAICCSLCSVLQCVAVSTRTNALDELEVEELDDRVDFDVCGSFRFNTGSKTQIPVGQNPFYFVHRLGLCDDLDDLYVHVRIDVRAIVCGMRAILKDVYQHVDV